LGWALYQRGKYSEALPFLDQSLRALDRPIAPYHLAAVLAKTGDMARARKEYELGVKQSPQAEVRKLLSPVFEKK
jgi:tetratricopeptide (TPR) repeat protein